MSKKKVSGVYRIFLRSRQGDENSYVGISKNIEAQWDQHVEEITKWYNNIDDCLDLILDQKARPMLLPKKEAPAFKIAVSMLVYGYVIEDLEFEILHEQDFQKDHEIVEKELEYIKKYDSEILGFNGLWEKHFAFTRAAIYAPEKAEFYTKLAKQELNKNRQLGKCMIEAEKENIVFEIMAWTLFELDSMLQLDGDYIDWLEFVDKLKEKVDKTQENMV